MKGKTGKMGAGLAVLYALLALVLLSGSTYAWFTFRAHTNVTPLSGVVGHGDGDLLIANSPGGPFDRECALILTDPAAQLLPVSTADLKSFYSVSTQDAAGVATAYRSADSRVNGCSLNGTVYLRADGSDFDVYLWTGGMDCGADTQALAAMRLGLRIQTSSGEQSYIFRLDEMGRTSGAQAQRTVPQSGKVVSAIGADGAPVYANDPARDLSSMAAGGTADNVTPGPASLCLLRDGETATVSYRLYLEGCDDNCINPVQGRDIALRLSFAGVQSND